MLASARLARLTVTERAARIEAMKLEDWHSHPGWKRLAKDVREEFADGTKTKDPASKRYDVVLQLALEFDFIGVTNAYLVEELKAFGVECASIYGQVDALLPCPCCSYRTLDERGTYSIYPVCFWEDDGAEKPTDVSGPNHVTLGEGRENLKKFGACSKRDQAFVDPEARLKYRHQDEGRRRFDPHGHRSVASTFHVELTPSGAHPATVNSAALLSLPARSLDNPRGARGTAARQLVSGDVRPTKNPTLTTSSRALASCPSTHDRDDCQGWSLAMKEVLQV